MNNEQFSIEISSDKSVSIEFDCKECGNKFSTEIDSYFKHQGFSEIHEDTLYCIYCEHPYKYNSSLDGNFLVIKFNESDLIGRLKYSQKIEEPDSEGLNSIKSFRFYNLQIERLEKIIELKTGEHIVDQTLFRLIYSGVITALETYLSEIFTQVVFYSNDTLEKFVSKYEPYKKEKYTLNEIFKNYNNLELRIRDDLDNFIYHNISKLIRIFNIFDFKLDNFHQIKILGNYIQKRHNFIHRSGVVAQESLIEITEKELKELIFNVNLFVEYVDEKFSNKCFSPYDDDWEIPF